MAASGSIGAAAGSGRNSLTLPDDIAAEAAGWATDGLMAATGGADTSAADCDVVGGGAIETGAAGIEALG